MRITVGVGVRWSDLDAYGHVNNTAVIRLLEEARIEAFWARGDGRESNSMAVLDGSPSAATITIVASQTAEYVQQIPYIREPLEIEVWLGKLGGASLEICYEVFLPETPVSPRSVAVKALTTIVLFDPKANAPRKISNDERTAWTPYLEEPVRFRRS
ncbi:acyl-CoA thioesterase [Humidisolicoccus flavus]|uniref:acyl-CoA thioesterase n=1 Tax=Humidisolicoccus flavus TaxID=3111414 RepID=UPI00324557A0